MWHSIVQFGNNTVTKTTAPHLMRIEVEKARRAFVIGRNCGLFRVPEVLDYDEAKGMAVFERIQTIQPVVDGIGQCRSIVERIGYSLALIHRLLSLPPGMTIPLPRELELPGTEVFFHGDFNGYNVCCDTCSHAIVILDWQMTGTQGGQATYGSRYFDLLWFVNYILWTPTIRYLFHDPVAPVAKIFLQSYFKAADIPYDPGMLVLYARRFFEVVHPFGERFGSRRDRYWSPYGRILTRRFLKSLKLMVPRQ
jgi:hypothetical protein